MSYEDLEAEVSARRARQQREPVRVSIPQQSATGPDAMDEVIRRLELAAQKHQAFADSIRPEFEAAPETIACEAHPSSRRVRNFDATVMQSGRHGYFRAEYDPCAECTSESEMARKRRFWAKRGVPERVVDSTFSNFVVDTESKRSAREAVRAWLKRRGTFLLLIGTTGTGKGHLASACLKAAEDGLFITHADMLTDLRASYTLHTTKELLETWQDTPMLVLDELGLSPGGRDEMPMLYQVLADRYDKRRPTIITSNLDLPEVKDLLGPRLIDRIAEDYERVVCRWSSYRTGR